MMNRRTFLLTATGGLSLGRAATPASHPNVVIFLADDLGWADVGFHGSEIRTPNIDRMTREGMQFNRFYAFPLCSPTRSALMTGRSPMRFGVAYHVIRPWMDYGVPLTEHFMPESFRAAGYQTCITGKWHLGHSRKSYLPNARGFDHAYGHLNGNIDYFTHMREGGLDWHRNGKSVREEGYSTDLIAAEASRFIAQRDRRRPFFLYVPFNAPHTPLQAPPERIEKYASIQDKKRRVFAAMVEAMDEGIGKVLGTIEQEGIAKDTIVLFCSDNGGPVAQGARNRPLRSGKGSPWEGGVRVPAVLRWPGKVRAGATSAQLISVIDVFPTLAAAAGVKPLNKLPLDGLDLWPEIISGKTRPRENLLFAVEAGEAFQYALYHREWKLVREVPHSGAPVNHLYRIEEDPEEKNDLAAVHPAVVKDLAARVDAWAKLYPANGVRAAAEPPPGWKAPQKWAEAARD